MQDSGSGSLLHGIGRSALLGRARGTGGRHLYGACVERVIDIVLFPRSGLLVRVNLAPRPVISSHCRSAYGVIFDFGDARKVSRTDEIIAARLCMKPDSCVCR